MTYLTSLRERRASRLADAADISGVDHTAAFPELSPTQRALAMLIVSGHGDTRVERMATLKMSERVYDTHRLTVMRKLGVRTDVQLTLVAVARGYLPAPTQTTQPSTDFDLAVAALRGCQLVLDVFDLEGCTDCDDTRALRQWLAEATERGYLQHTIMKVL